MVEVGMVLDQLPKTKTEKIISSRFLHKDAKYKLFGALFSATMHREYSHRKIEFEISIGTNVYEPDIAQRPAFFNPKSEVDHYYSLKWEGQPEIQVR
jgi:hypothetical protein